MANAHSTVANTVTGIPQVRTLAQTQQKWHLHNNGTSRIYNTPIQTGTILDAQQGKNPDYLGTCGIVSCVNVLRLAGRVGTTEPEVLSYAASRQFCVTNSTQPAARGGTTPNNRKEILAQFGLESELLPASTDAIAAYVSAGKGVIISVDAGRLWQIPAYFNCLHAVTVTSVQKDPAGNVEGFYICDSGRGTNDAAHFYTAEHLKKSLLPRSMNVTTSIIR